MRFVRGQALGTARGDELAKLWLIGDNPLPTPGKADGNVAPTEFKSAITCQSLQETQQVLIRSTEHRTELTMSLSGRGDGGARTFG